MPKSKSKPQRKSRRGITPKAVVGFFVVTFVAALAETYSRATLWFAVIGMSAVYVYVCWRDWFGEKYWKYSNLLLIPIAVGAIGTAWSVMTAQPAPQEVSGSVSVKFSETQTVEAASVPGNYRKALNLGNAGSMVIVSGSDLDRVELVLSSAPGLDVDSPRRGEVYGQGPIRIVPGSGEMRDLKITTGRETFVFERTGPYSSHKVVVNKRTFLVSLQGVRDASRPEVRHLIYTFSVVEQ